MRIAKERPHPESLTQNPLQAISSSCKPARQEAHAGNKDPCFRTGDSCFEVLGEAPVASEPSEGALNDRSPRLRFEGAEALRPGDDFNRPLSQIGERIEQLWSAIDAVGEDVAQAAECAPDGPQHRHGSV